MVRTAWRMVFPPFRESQRRGDYHDRSGVIASASSGRGSERWRRGYAGAWLRPGWWRLPPSRPGSGSATRSGPSRTTTRRPTRPTCRRAATTISSASAGASSPTTASHIGKDAEDPALRYAGNDLACANCHLDAGLKPFAAPFVSTWTSYPMMVDDRVLTLDRAHQRLHAPEHERQAAAGGRPRDGRRCSPICATSGGTRRRACGSPAWG